MTSPLSPEEREIALAAWTKAAKDMMSIDNYLRCVEAVFCAGRAAGIEECAKLCKRRAQSVEEGGMIADVIREEAGNLATACRGLLNKEATNGD